MPSLARLCRSKNKKAENANIETRKIHSGDRQWVTELLLKVHKQSIKGVEQETLGSRQQRVKRTQWSSHERTRQRSRAGNGVPHASNPWGGAEGPGGRGIDRERPSTVLPASSGCSEGEKRFKKKCREPQVSVVDMQLKISTYLHTKNYDTWLVISQTDDTLRFFHFW